MMTLLLMTMWSRHCTRPSRIAACLLLAPAINGKRSSYSCFYRVAPGEDRYHQTGGSVGWHGGARLSDTLTSVGDGYTRLRTTCRQVRYVPRLSKMSQSTSRILGQN